MSNVQLSGRRSTRRWAIIVSAIVLLSLFVVLFSWWQLKRNGITIKSLFPLEVATKSELHFNAVSGGHYGRSFWCFSTSEGEFLFAIGFENIPGRHSLHPGLQALLSDELLIPSFLLHFDSQYLQVHYDAESDSLEIGDKKYERQRGNVFLLRGKAGAFEIAQYAVTVNQKEFRDRGGLSLLDEIDKVLPPGERK